MLAAAVGFIVNQLPLDFRKRLPDAGFEIVLLMLVGEGLTR